DGDPAGRRGEAQLEPRLEVGLVEAGVHAPGVGRLELAVEVDVAVDRVDEPVQPLAGAGVGALRDDAQLVVGGEGGQVDAHAVETADVGRLTVQRRLAAGRGGEVDERGRAGLPAAEPDLGGGEERLPARGQVEVDPVGLDVEQARALAGVVTGQ